MRPPVRLERVEIENFRGVRRLDMSFDDVTVLIAENRHGKATVFDALGLCLGLRGVADGAHFRASDFLAAGGEADAGAAEIRITLTFVSDSEAIHEHHRVAFIGTAADRRVQRAFVDVDGVPLAPQPSLEALDALLSAHPVLMLRFAHPRTDNLGGLGEAEEGHPARRAESRRGGGNLAATIARVYHDLAHTRGPVSAEQISVGLQAAHRLLEEGVAEVDGPQPVHRVLDDLRSEVQKWGRATPSDSSLDLSGSGSHNLALLLVLGSILEVHGGRELEGPTNPIIMIEEPEAHLHPVLLASTWDVIEALHAQTIVTTNSGELLSSVPMVYLRRLVRTAEDVAVHRLDEQTLTPKDLRRVAYHVRAKRGGVLFARCWMLVEGESEFWLLNQLAEVLGYDLEAEGVRMIEFAQCGVAPLAKLANDLGIPWHLLTDGDDSGSVYAKGAQNFLGDADRSLRISMLGHRDIEQCLWHYGFDDIYRDAARIADRPDGQGPPPQRIIQKAVRKRSKPFLALAVAEAAAERGAASIPPVLRNTIETSVVLARRTVAAFGR
ncbi:MAG: DUF2813 domain-containing protein [Gemmatimonadota bacterium]